MTGISQLTIGIEKQVTY